MKRKDFFIKFVYVIVIAISMLLILEITQRVRYYYRSGKSPYWLMYGFVRFPKDYEDQLCRMIQEKKVKSAKGVIQVYEKEFPGGIKKHNTDFPEYKGQINSLGFRSYEFTPEKPKDVYRIIAAGSSTTAGYESDIDHTFPALLQKRLNERMPPTKRFEVINTGKGEASLDYINDLLQIELVGYKPDMAILYYTFIHLHLYRSSLKQPESFAYKMYKLKKWLWEKSLFFLTFQEKMNMLFCNRGASLGDIYMPYDNSGACAKAFMNTPEVFKTYRNGLDEFISTCRSNGITPVLVSEAYLLSDGFYIMLGREMDPVYKRMRDIMDDTARENGILFIDAAGKVAGMPNEADLFSEGSHLNSKGNEVLAEIIYDGIRDKI